MQKQGLILIARGCRLQTRPKSSTTMKKLALGYQQTRSNSVTPTSAYGPNTLSKTGKTETELEGLYAGVEPSTG
jgi:hypothetical protein